MTRPGVRRLKRSAARPVPARPASRGRLAIGYSAAAATVPYLILKVLWVSGSTVGMTNPATFHDSAYLIANVLSILADAVAVGVAVALTVARGRRLSPPLILLPAWIATGLLGTVLVLAPVAAPLARTTSTGNGDDALRGWVYLLVYGSFSVQGLLLLTAFVLYSRDRWWSDLRQALTGAKGAPWVPAAIVLAALSVAVGLLHLTWSFGIRAGLGSLAARQTGVDRATLAVHGLFAVAAAGGMLLTFRPQRGPWWLPPTLVWCGTASMVTWGGYTLALGVWQPSLTSPMLAWTTAAKVAFGLGDAVLIGALVRRELARRELSISPNSR